MDFGEVMAIWKNIPNFLELFIVYYALEMSRNNHAVFPDLANLS